MNFSTLSAIILNWGKKQGTCVLALAFKILVMQKLVIKNIGGLGCLVLSILYQKSQRTL